MFTFKQKDYENEVIRYKQSITVNVRTSYGRKRLLQYAFENYLGTIQAVSYKEQDLIDISIEMYYNRLYYNISILLLYLIPVFILLGIWNIVFISLAILSLIFSIIFNKKVNKHMLNYVAYKYDYNSNNYLPYSLIIKREDLFKKL